MSGSHAAARKGDAIWHCVEMTARGFFFSLRRNSILTEVSESQKSRAHRAGEERKGCSECVTECRDDISALSTSRKLEHVSCLFLLLPQSVSVEPDKVDARL